MSKSVEKRIAVQNPIAGLDEEEVQELITAMDARVLAILNWWKGDGPRPEAMARARNLQTRLLATLRELRS